MLKLKNSGVHELAARLTKQLRRVEALAEPTVAGDAAKRLSVLEGVSVFFMQPKSVVRSLARESRQVTVKNGDDQGSPLASVAKRLFALRRRVLA
jgi:hypothetical protein